MITTVTGVVGVEIEHKTTINHKYGHSAVWCDQSNLSSGWCRPMRRRDESVSRECYHHTALGLRAVIEHWKLSQLRGIEITALQFIINLLCWTDTRGPMWWNTRINKARWWLATGIPSNTITTNLSREGLKKIQNNRQIGIQRFNTDKGVRAASLS